MTIAFVCTGNSCRSPLAQALFEKLLRDSGREGVRCFSCGTDACPGGCASENAVAAGQELGVDLTAHRSQQLCRDLLEDTDLIVTMSAWQAGLVSSQWTSALRTGKQVRVLGGGIADPYGGDLESYRNCAREMQTALEDLLRELP